MAIEYIYDVFVDLFVKLGASELISKYITEIVFIVILSGLAFLVFYILRNTLLGNVGKLVNKASRKKRNWFGDLLQSPALISLLKLIIAIILSKLTGVIPTLAPIIDIILLIVVAYSAVKTISDFIDVLNELYNKYNSQAKNKPIKGLLSVVKFMVFAIATILVVARILGQSPVYILTGLGAMSAVIMLIFKDSILGFVAGFQMSSNDLVRIGDWIEMPKYGADGSVIDISLTFVKVQNWDKTIVTIPSYALVSDSFSNWRGMFENGGRRIKRSINIDVSSVGFCSEELLSKLEKVEFLKDYLKERQAEIKTHNTFYNIDTSVKINGRHLTNLGVYRAYLTEYIKRHPKIHKDMFIMVRQLQNQNDGIPLEVYAFTNDTAWVNYEIIMADIFDHIYASVSYFGLKIFQNPSGSDISKIKVGE